MTVKSIVDIEINSSEFQRFNELFNQYHEALAKTPSAWADAAKASKGATSEWEKGVAAIVAQRQMTRELVDGTKDYAGAVGTTASVWHKISESGKSFLDSISRVSREFEKWGSSAGGAMGRLGGFVTGALGIVTGAAAGVLAGADRMAGDVAQQRQTAMGFGMSIGELKAFRTNFNRLVDPDSFLGWVNEMETHPEKASAFFALTGHGLSGSAESDATQALEAVWRKAQTTPLAYLGTLLQAYGVPLSNEQERRLKGTGSAEFWQLLAQNRLDVTRFNVDSGAAWQNLKTQLERNWEVVTTEFERQLGAAAPAIERFTDALTTKAVKAIDDLFAETESGTQKIAALIGSSSAPQPGDLPGDAARREVASVAAAIADSPRVGGSFTGNARKWIWDPLRAIFAGTGDTALKLWQYADYAGWRKQFEANPTLAAWSQSASALEKEVGLPQGLLEAVKRQESGTMLAGVPTGAAGEIGVMQLKPDVATRYGVNAGDPLQSQWGAAQYLMDLYKRFQNWQEALAAYNWGEGNVARDLAKYGKDWFEHLPASTQRYVHNVGGPSTIRLAVTVTAPPGTNVSQVSAALGPGP